MPRKPRSAEEIDIIKQQILAEALFLISKEGYDNFSMRKLAQRLNIAAKTIYNYFASKDEIYLCVLKNGFDQLHDAIASSIATIDDPFGKLREIKNVYLQFAVKKSNYYDIMFTLYVPKRDDFIGTELELLATQELRSAMNVGQLFIDTIEEIAETYGTVPKSDARTLFIQFWTSLHGIVATYNNKLLGYLEKYPLETLEEIAERHLEQFKPKELQQSARNRLGS